MPPSPRAGDRRVPRRLELAAARESRVRTSLRCRTRSSEDCAQPASGLRARGRATDSLVHAGQSRRRAAVLPGRSCLLSRVGFPTPFPPVGGGVQARPPGAEEPEGPRSPREGGRAGRRSGKHKARAPAKAGGGGGGVSGRPQEEGALEPSRRAAGGGAEGGRRRRGAGRGEAGTRSRGGEGGGAAVAGASLVSAPASHSPSTSDRPGLRRGAACRSPEPPCCRRPLPPLAGSPSVPAPCAPPSGPWMGKCSAAQQPRRAALAPLPFALGPTRRGRGAGRGAGGPRSGPGRARRRGFREPPRGAPSRGGAARRSVSCPHGAPRCRPPLRTLARGSGGCSSRGRPPRRESGEAGPASRHFLSENGARRWGRRGRRRRSGRASSRSGSCCLPARWGERWSFPWRGGERPPSGGCTRLDTSGRRPGPAARPHAGARRAGDRPGLRMCVL